MIQDLKIGLKLVKYGINLKSNLFGAIVCLVVGIVISILEIMYQHVFPGGYFMAIATQFLLQLVFSTVMTSMVACSPMNKRILTRIIPTVGVFSANLVYFLVIIMETIALLVYPQKVAYFTGRLLFTAIVLCLLQLYYSIDYKLFVLGTCVFVVVFVTVYYYVMSDKISFLIPVCTWRGFAITAVICEAVILLFGLLQYPLTLLVYRLPFSKYVQSGVMKKAI